MVKDWFKEWFDENYLLLYRHRDMDDAECQFRLIIRETSPDKNWKILDLACGEGRYSALFRERGFDITGLDLSETMIRSGREKFKDLDLRVGDMRNIRGKYDLILSLFTSFGYFQDEGEDRKVLRSVRSSLNPGGLFWLDLFNSERIKKGDFDRQTVRSIEGINVTEERKISGRRMIKEITFSSGCGEKKYLESVRMYTRDELIDMLTAQGLTVTGTFGDYSGSEWEKGSERTIIMCKLFSASGGK